MIGTRKIAAAFGVVALLVGGLALSASAAQAAQVHKSYVCKYVTTPGEDERLQTGDNPIWVDNSSLLGNDGTTFVGQEFKDGQERSVVIVANTPRLNPEPGLDDCPKVVVTPPPTTAPPTTAPPTTAPPTTTVPPTTAPPTTEPPTTTAPPITSPVTTPSVIEVTDPPPTEEVTPILGPATKYGAELPKTGLSALQLALIALAMIAAGAATKAWRAPKGEHN